MAGKKQKLGACDGAYWKQLPKNISGFGVKYQFPGFCLYFIKRRFNPACPRMTTARRWGKRSFSYGTF